MKKALLTALCLLLIGCLTIGGTLATSVTDSVKEIFQTISNLVSPEPTSKPDQLRVTVSDGASEDGVLLFPGTSATITNTVKNESKSTEKAAYFRLYYAVPKDDKITVSFENLPEKLVLSTETPLIKDDLKVYVLTYTDTLSAGASVSVSVTVTFDSSMTDEEFAKYSDGKFLQTQVCAIEADAFTEKDYTGAEAALNAALPLDTNPFN